MDQFRQKGFEIYLVGGAIRHLLLGQETHNWDFTTNATPTQIQELFPNNFYNNVFQVIRDCVERIAEEMGVEKLKEDDL